MGADDVARLAPAIVVGDEAAVDGRRRQGGRQVAGRWQVAGGRQVDFFRFGNPDRYIPHLATSR
jgi:hypothetical protein